MAHGLLCSQVMKTIHRLFGLGVFIWALFAGMNPAETLAQAPANADAHGDNLSKAGPIAEITTGAVVALATPAASFLTALAAGGGLFPCGVLVSEEDDEYRACREKADRKSGGYGTLVAVVGSALAAGLITHGAIRLHRVKKARHALMPTAWDLDATRQRADLSLSWQF